MLRKLGWALLLSLVIVPGAVLAGTDGDDDGGHKKNCWWGDYSIFHYWVPGWFEREPGFTVPIWTSIRRGPRRPVCRAHCTITTSARSGRAGPSAWYANPEAYYWPSADTADHPTGPFAGPGTNPVDPAADHAAGSIKSEPRMKHYPCFVRVRSVAKFH